MKIYDLSREIMSTRPFEGDPAPAMTRLANMADDGYNLSTIAMSLHAATHVDAPLHFIRRGKDVASLPAEIFVGECTVMTVPGRRLDAMYFMRYPSTERLLLRSGPNKTDKAITELNRGDAVYVYYQVGEFYYVQVATTGKKGFAYASYISAEKSVPTK